QVLQFPLTLAQQRRLIVRSKLHRERCSQSSFSGKASFTKRLRKIQSYFRGQEEEIWIVGRAQQGSPVLVEQPRNGHGKSTIQRGGCVIEIHEHTRECSRRASVAVLFCVERFAFVEE